MKNLSIANVTTPKCAVLIQRIQYFLGMGFQEVQPLAHTTSGCSLSIKDTLLSSKMNFPFGMDITTGKYVKEINWDFSKIDFNKPVSSISIFLAFGMYSHSLTLLENVGRKKIKVDNQWSFRKANGIPVLHAMNKFQPFSDSLIAMSNSDVEKSISDAQDIVDACCTVVLDDSAQLHEKPKSTFTMYLNNITLACLNLETNRPLHDCSLSINQRLLFNKICDVVGKFPSYDQLQGHRILAKLLTASKCSTALIISIFEELIKKFETLIFFFVELELEVDFVDILDSRDKEIVAA
ncbi:hypothetical protein AMD27_17735 (plasmid) [Acinetobacter sp. TGL-Y2]|uniref:hypothetical protein n=1 Tax=Acinetobacter sp. TGL-Y2 TaxID=1407071 RepID=UPI0007A67211|nr:hypothetical protein [Acinetobacter sp. TGL-Y2]AMW80758.1 hypothetical protein AMD27_17735 [Acinetobacter sp. TGL-Y2]